MEDGARESFSQLNAFVKFIGNKEANPSLTP